MLTVLKIILRIEEISGKKIVGKKVAGLAKCFFFMQARTYESFFSASYTNEFQLSTETPSTPPPSLKV